MLICFHSPGGAALGSAGPATSTRPSAGDSTSVGSCGEYAIGIAEEVEKEGGEKKQWHGAGGADGQSRRNRKSGRATDEGIPCAIDRHPTILIPINQCEIAGGAANEPDALAAMAAQDIFHPVFELQLAFLESDFFDLLGL